MPERVESDAPVADEPTRRTYRKADDIWAYLQQNPQATMDELIYQFGNDRRSAFSRVLALHQAALLAISGDTPKTDSEPVSTHTGMVLTEGTRLYIELNEVFAGEHTDPLHTLEISHTDGIGDFPPEFWSEPISIQNEPLVPLPPSEPHGLPLSGGNIAAIEKFLANPGKLLTSDSPDLLPAAPDDSSQKTT